jgi:hypothetical protein
MLVGAALSACGTSSSVGSRSPSVDPKTLTWTNRPTTTSAAGGLAAMAYDPEIGKVVQFAGETWTYDGTTWTMESPATSPPAYMVTAMAYDQAIRRIVLFGAMSAGTVTGDTWTYDGTTWTQQHPGTNPGPLAIGPVMAYDAAIGKLVLLAGETWTYDGTTWTKESPPANPRANEYGVPAPLTYDAALKKLVLYSAGTTWTYDGTTWTAQSSSIYPPRIFGWSMAYYPALGRTVLFGGVQYDPTQRGHTGNYLRDTWSYDGRTWTQQFPSSSTAPLWGPMVNDDALNSLVLYSPQSLGGPETWTYGPPTGGSS